MRSTTSLGHGLTGPKNVPPTSGETDHHVAEYELDDRYTAERGRVLLSGVEALVRLFLDQHHFDERHGLHTATFVSGYPGSPLGTLDLVMRRAQQILDRNEILLVPGVNEELAASAVWGTQQVALAPNQSHDGVIGVWYGKGPGVDRCGDVFRHANNVGVATNGGVLVIAGDDPSQKSSTIPSRSEVALFDVGMPVLSPGNIQDILDLGIHGLALSRYSGLWVGFQIVTDVADGIGTADVDLDRLSIAIPEQRVGDSIWRHEPIPVPMDRSVEAEQQIFLHRLEAAKLYARANALNRITVAPEKASLGIVASGKTYFDLRQALETLGLTEDALIAAGVRILKIGMLWPLDNEIVTEFARGLKTVLVVEEKRGFLEMLLRDVLYNCSDRPRVIGKWNESGNPLVPADGELTADRLLPILASVLSRRDGLESVLARLPTKPRIPALIPLAPADARHAFFCSGCPHNRSTVVPEGSIAGGGIGCHTMALSRPRNVGLMPMGGEGANWIGRAPYTGTPHIFQNLGDGTYFHSGSLAIRACVAARVNITFKLLFNSAVAMTGGQTPPGGFDVPRLASELVAEGVSGVVVVTDDERRYRGASLPPGVTVRSRDDLDAVQIALREVSGTTVLIYDQACAAEQRRKRKRGEVVDPPVRIMINEAVCEGCGDCGVKSNCLSVQPIDTEFGRKTHIHQSSCNKDYTCIDGDCPSFVKVRVATHATKPMPRKVLEPHFLIPDPNVVVHVQDGWSMLLSGIGGTGVVTVNRVLATAAVMEGYHVAGVDQTGISQKAGPVVSHLKLATHPIVAANSIGAGGTDCFLGLDSLVAADSRNLARATATRTRSVLSTSKIPTGRMVASVDSAFPPLAPIFKAVEAVTLPGATTYVDSETLAEVLFGDHMAANIIVVGVAYQSGLLPMAAESIERALKLNGASVAMNIAAFRWGRAAVANPGEVQHLMVGEDSHRVGSSAPAELHRSKVLRRAEQLLAGRKFEGELARLVQIRVPELVDYQSAALAKHYLAVVERVSSAEDAVASGHSALAEAVARNLFKLMAYKDEYEVARLYLSPAFTGQLAREFGDAKVTVLLHPPFLRALGRRKKIGLSGWFTPGFHLLRGLRFLRGTPFDVFGLSKVRRTERALIIEYEALITRALESLDPGSLERVVKLASLPDGIRGYEQIKLANVEAFRREVAELGY